MPELIIHLNEEIERWQVDIENVGEGFVFEGASLEESVTLMRGFAAAIDDEEVNLALFFQTELDMSAEAVEAYFGTTDALNFGGEIIFEAEGAAETLLEVLGEVGDVLMEAVAAV